MSAARRLEPEDLGGLPVRLYRELHGWTDASCFRFSGVRRRVEPWPDSLGVMRAIYTATDGCRILRVVCNAPEGALAGLTGQDREGQPWERIDKEEIWTTEDGIARWTRLGKPDGRYSVDARYLARLEELERALVECHGRSPGLTRAAREAERDRVKLIAVLTIQVGGSNEPIVATGSAPGVSITAVIMPRKI